MKKNYKDIIPKIFYSVDYEKDIPEEIKEIFRNQVGILKQGIYFHGPPGVGKTHIVCALIKEMTEHGIDVKFYNTGDFLEKLREEFKNTVVNDDYQGLFRETMDFEGVLIFDDIGAEKISDWATERLYLIINKKYEDMIPTIFTSNCDLEILSARMGDRVTSRIVGMTKVIGLDGQDRRLIKSQNEK